MRVVPMDPLGQQMYSRSRLRLPLRLQVPSLVLVGFVMKTNPKP